MLATATITTKDEAKVSMTVNVTIQINETFNVLDHLRVLKTNLFQSFILFCYFIINFLVFILC